MGSGNQLGPARTGQEMVPLAVPARSLGWGSARDTLYLKSLEFPCDASSCDDTRVPVFMREDRNQTRESSLTCIPALLSSSDPEVVSLRRVAIPIPDRKAMSKKSCVRFGVHSRCS